MKWIGQHIVDFIARFRSDVYLEDISTGTIASGGNLGLDSNNKVVKADEDGATLTQEQVEDFAGAMVATGGTKTGISVTYQDGTGDMDFVVDHDTATNFEANEHYTQANIVATGTISSGVWQGTAVASAYLDTDTAHLSGAQSFTGAKTFSAGIIPSFVRHSISGNGTAEYGPGAEILFGISAETTTAGAIYVLRSGTWTLIDADFPNRCRQLAAVAVGTDSALHGMLIRGCVTLASVFTAGTDAEGIRVFASTTAGQATITAPSATGDTVRVLGYSLNAGDKKMFFNPDNTHVEIA